MNTATNSSVKTRHSLRHALQAMWSDQVAAQAALLRMHQHQRGF